MKPKMTNLDLLTVLNVFGCMTHDQRAAALRVLRDPLRFAEDDTNDAFAALGIAPGMLTLVDTRPVDD